MKPIKVTIMGRQFPLKVEESDEELMYEIATFVDNRIRTYKKELTNQAEPIIMILACLSIAEELYKAKRDQNGVSQTQPASADVPESVDTSGLNALLNEILVELRQ
jgi:cell division protein ZapA